MAQIKNIKDLRDELCDAFDKLTMGNLKKSEAKEIANMAGKIISSTKVEIDYAKLNKNGKVIDFLEYENNIEVKVIHKDNEDKQSA